MASNTAVTEGRRKIRKKNAGVARKKQQSRKSTPSAAELFAAFDNPSAQPAPAKTPAQK